MMKTVIERTRSESTIITEFTCPIENTEFTCPIEHTHHYVPPTMTKTPHKENKTTSATSATAKENSTCTPIASESRSYPDPHHHTRPSFNRNTLPPDTTMRIRDTRNQWHHANGSESESYDTKWPINVCVARERIQVEQAKLEDIMQKNWEWKRKEWVKQSNQAIAGA